MKRKGFSLGCVAIHKADLEQGLLGHYVKPDLWTDLSLVGLYLQIDSSLVGSYLWIDLNLVRSYLQIDSNLSLTRWPNGAKLWSNHIFGSVRVWGAASKVPKKGF